MKKIASVVVSLALSVGGAVAVSTVAATPAQAACTYTNAWTDFEAGWSDTFKIGSGGSCKDLNAKYTLRVADKVRGQYLKSGKWIKGERGFRAVPAASSYKSGQTVLLSDVKDGVTVRGEGTNYGQYVRYMH